jgi:hypothetical protein
MVRIINPNHADWQDGKWHHIRFFRYNDEDVVMVDAPCYTIDLSKPLEWNELQKACDSFNRMLTHKIDEYDNIDELR